jgi:hypothetical protein
VLLTARSETIRQLDEKYLGSSRLRGYDFAFRSSQLKVKLNDLMTTLKEESNEVQKMFDNLRGSLNEARNLRDV